MLTIMVRGAQCACKDGNFSPFLSNFLDLTQQDQVIEYSEVWAGLGHTNHLELEQFKVYCKIGQFPKELHLMAW